MRTPLAALCVSLSLLCGPAFAQTPPAPAPQTPAKPSPAKPRAAAAPASTTTTVTLTVTDGVGRPVDAVDVTAAGPLDRSGTTDLNGTLRLQGLRVGTYRLRFDKEGFLSFEKEIATRAGQRTLDFSVTLTAAPEPPSPPPPVPAAPPPRAQEEKLPAPGDARTLMLTEWLEKNFISNREPQKVSTIGCSGLSEAVVWQVREPWTGRQNEKADTMLYVVGGEGTLRLDQKDVSVGAGSFAVVPRDTSYGLTRRGRNPLIVLAVLSGTAC